MNNISRSILLVTAILLVVAIPIIYDQHRTVRVIRSMNTLHCEIQNSSKLETQVQNADLHKNEPKYPLIEDDYSNLTNDEKHIMNIRKHQQNIALNNHIEQDH